MKPLSINEIQAGRFAVTNHPKLDREMKCPCYILRRREHYADVIILLPAPENNFRPQSLQDILAIEVQLRHDEPFPRVDKDYEQNKGDRLDFDLWETDKSHSDEKWIDAISLTIGLTQGKESRLLGEFHEKLRDIQRQQTLFYAVVTHFHNTRCQRIQTG